MTHKHPYLGVSNRKMRHRVTLFRVVLAEWRKRATFVIENSVTK